MLRGEEEERGRKRPKKRRREEAWKGVGNRERFVKATSVHELRKNFCSILFLHCSLVLKNTVKRFKTSVYLFRAFRSNI